MATNVKLTSEEKTFIKIPQKLIIDTELSSERIALYVYLKLHSIIIPKPFRWIDWKEYAQTNNFAFDSQIQYDKNEICKWLGRTPLYKKDITDCSKRIENVIKGFINNNIIQNPQRIKYNLFYANLNESYDTNFYKLFVDEINKIIDYKSDKYKSVNKANVILVFAYLRFHIPINNVGTSYVEAFDCFYRDIAKDIGIGDDAVQKAILVLNDIGLIYSEDYEYASGKFILTTHIFSNTYKRDTVKEILIASGESYYKNNIAQQKEKLNKMYKSLSEKCILRAGGETNEST